MEVISLYLFAKQDNGLVTFNLHNSAVFNNTRSTYVPTTNEMTTMSKTAVGLGWGCRSLRQNQESTCKQSQILANIDLELAQNFAMSSFWGASRPISLELWGEYYRWQWPFSPTWGIYAEKSRTYYLRSVPFLVGPKPLKNMEKPQKALRSAFLISDVPILGF